jgi:hypothetical protein
LGPLVRELAQSPSAAQSLSAAQRLNLIAAKIKKFFGLVVHAAHAEFPSPNQERPARHPRLSAGVLLNHPQDIARGERQWRAGSVQRFDGKHRVCARTPCLRRVTTRNIHGRTVG